jgi:predicted nucleic acid-binding Zn ribbon protein
MPTYVYKFVETGETIEVQQSFTDPSLTEAVHPTSGRAMPVKKVFTPVGVTFKGGGFYKTDSRGGSKSSSSGSTSTGSSDSASAGSGDSTSSSNPSSTESSSAAASAAPAPAKTPAATS